MARYQTQRQRNCLATKGRFDFIVVLDSLKAGFNVPKIFRSAQALGAAEVHLINIRPFDPVPAKGAFKYVPARFYGQFSDCYANLNDRDYQLYTLEPGENAALFDASLVEKSAVIVGHEEMGLSFDRALYPKLECLSIPQFGGAQSMNVRVAASMIMYEYVRQHRSGNQV